ncbi:hypothetical protein EDD22DRAFT_958215 [Suillus occidentalis]|nr:hypothetical protein EDD22DRAFT_958215 [Suillus occidentalis]
MPPQPPIKLFCYILGGDSPGIKTKRPFIGASRTSPAFPIATYCRSEDEVREISRAQSILQSIDLDDAEVTTLAYRVSRALQSASGILVEWDRFYPVVYGRHVGIYLRWDDVVPEVNGREIRRFQRVETFLDALTYMITKGAYSSVSSLPPVAGMDAGPSFGSLSHPISSNVLLSRPKIGESNSFNVPSMTTSFQSQLRISSPSSSYTTSKTKSITGSQSTKYVYRFIRSLSGVVGSIVSADKDNEEDDDYPPSGILGIAAEKYLKAHGYKASAVWSIIFAFRESFSPEDFTAYLCPKGVSQLEAEYMFELISGREIWFDQDS